MFHRVRGGEAGLGQREFKLLGAEVPVEEGGPTSHLRSEGGAARTKRAVAVTLFRRVSG